MIAAEEEYATTASASKLAGPQDTTVCGKESRDGVRPGWGERAAGGKDGNSQTMRRMTPISGGDRE